MTLSVKITGLNVKWMCFDMVCVFVCVCVCLLVVVVITRCHLWSLLIANDMDATFEIHLQSEEVALSNPLSFWGPTRALTYVWHFSSLIATLGRWVGCQGLPPTFPGLPGTHKKMFCGLISAFGVAQQSCCALLLGGIACRSTCAETKTERAVTMKGAKRAKAETTVAQQAQAAADNFTPTFPHTLPPPHSHSR